MAIQEVGDREWTKMVGIVNKRKYPDVVEAVELLMEKPHGYRIKIEAGDNASRKRKALQSAARVRGLSTSCYLTEGWIYVRSIKCAVKSNKGETRLNTGEQKITSERGPLTSRERSSQTGGSNARL
jgi:hypothetical protein